MLLLEAQELTKTFGDQGASVRALNRVSLQIRSGEFVAIMGPSGSGKSTLLHLLAGLDTPTAGRVVFEGVDLATLSDDQRTRLRRRKLGFVFQSFNLLPHLTADENVAMPLLLDGVNRHESLVRAADALRAMGVLHRRGHVPSRMSGGERQRVAIARALVCQPAVVFADEPTGNLDTKTGADIANVLQVLCIQHARTILLVTHDRTIAERGTRVVFMVDGTLQQTEEARTNGTMP